MTRSELPDLARQVVWPKLGKDDVPNGLVTFNDDGGFMVWRRDNRYSTMHYYETTKFFAFSWRRENWWRLWWQDSRAALRGAIDLAKDGGLLEFRKMGQEISLTRFCKDKERK